MATKNVNNAAEDAAKKAAEAAAAATATTTEAAPAAETPATATPAQPAKTEAKPPLYKRPGFWLSVAGVTLIAGAFGAGYKRGEKAGREAALAEVEEDKIGAAIGAGLTAANDHNDRGSNGGNCRGGGVDNNRR